MDIQKTLALLGEAIALMRLGRDEAIAAANRLRVWKQEALAKIKALEEWNRDLERRLATRVADSYELPVVGERYSVVLDRRVTKKEVVVLRRIISADDVEVEIIGEPGPYYRVHRRRLEAPASGRLT
jgi:hypothetical protein